MNFDRIFLCTNRLNTYSVKVDVKIKEHKPMDISLMYSVTLSAHTANGLKVVMNNLEKTLSENFVAKFSEFKFNTEIHGKSEIDQIEKKEIEFWKHNEWI